MTRFYHDPRIDGLVALGIADVDELLDPELPPIDRAQVVERDPRRLRVRFPLPGTPDTEDGPLTAEPKGAGTGWVVLERFTRSPWRELAASRLTHPRSASLAERHWNLLCHLRANGVGTPEPLAVGARGAGPVARESFVVTRELDGFEPFPEWLAREAVADARARGLRVLGAALGKLFGARVHLPHLRPEHLHISHVEPGAGCDWRAELIPGSLRLNRLPSVVLTSVEGASIRPRLTAGEIAAMLVALDRPLADGVRLTDRERLALLRGASRSFDRTVRREVWREVRRAPRG